MEPILLDVPAELTTQRLLLRVPRAGDGQRVYDAVRDSADELAAWMPWARPTPQLENQELWCRNAAVKFLAREQFHFSLYLKGTDTCIGVCGLQRVDMKVPMVEMGYWLRTQHCRNGYMHEAVTAVTEFALAYLKAQRVEIRCDVENLRSARVADRAGFQLEGILRNYSRGLNETLRSTKIYSKIAGE
jgi:RimJ/RimL family protein N-acetyltransferase